MVPLDRFTVVLDACTIFPMLVRDVLLTLASHGFFSPKWSQKIKEEWIRNLTLRIREHDPDRGITAQIQWIADSMALAFPDAEIITPILEIGMLEPVDPKDRHVVMTAIAARADAIITFNLSDFTAAHLRRHLGLEVIHPDDLVMDLVDLNEKRAVVAFRELRERKKHPPWDSNELVQRLRKSRLIQTSLWLASDDVSKLV
ncbi:MAG: PIN domain-containing protein [Candidatus Competibacteraceae bacterium]